MKALDKLFSLVDKYEIISFDIFDTIIKRPFITPTNLFSILEEKTGTPNFANIRIQAESTALKSLQKSEVTLDDIYQFIPSELSFIKDIELESELNAFLLNDDIVSVYHYAKKKEKKIIFISDTYFDSSFIKKALRKCGIDSSELYLSSELSCTKRHGDLFFKATQKFNAQKILHIGDNYYSDILNASKNGITTYHYNSFPDEFCKRALENNISALNKTALFQLPAVLDYISSKIPLPNFWESIGINFAGPMAFSFVNWIRERMITNGISDVIFVARDGYYLDQIFKLMAGNLRSHYLYASRAVISQLQNSTDDKQKFLNQITELDLLGKKVAIVDVGTNNFTTQRFFADLGLDTKGFYWCTGPKKFDLDFEKFYKNDCTADEYFLGSGIIEFFMTSPEAPVMGMNFKLVPYRPEYRKVRSKVETYRIQSIEKLGRGILTFSSFALNDFKNLNFNLDAHAIIHWTNLILLKPTLYEQKNLEQIYHASNSDHTEYERQFNFDHVQRKNISSYVKKVFKRIGHFKKRFLR